MAVFIMAKSRRVEVAVWFGPAHQHLPQLCPELILNYLLKPLSP